MTFTPNLGLPELAAAQAQKHVTHNEALRLLDAVVQLSVLDRDLAAPPGAPADGQRWIVGAGATGGWEGHDREVAVAVDGGWRFVAPLPGWIAFVADENAPFYWSGTAWLRIGGTTRLSFHAKKSGNQSPLPANTPTKIVFDTEGWDLGGVYDTATSRFVPPAGKYCVSAVVHVGGIEDNTRLACLLYRNGGLYRANYESSAGTQNQNASIDVVIDANGTDYFELYVVAEGTTDKLAFAGDEITWFLAYEI